MRDSTDPAGGRQPNYASGVAQPEAPQPTGTRQQPTQQPPETFETPQSDRVQQAPGTFDTPQGATGAEQVRAGTDVPPPPTQTETAQAQQSAPQYSGTTQQDAGIWDATKADEFRHRWHDVQTHFVEDPRGSLTEARQLVDEAVQSLAASVHDREEQLERAGARSSDSTEGMRDTVLQYHQLLDRLLTV
jgi:hypothetical protein